MKLKIRLRTRFGENAHQIVAPSTVSSLKYGDGGFAFGAFPRHIALEPVVRHHVVFRRVRIVRVDAGVLRRANAALMNRIFTYYKIVTLREQTSRGQ